MLSKSSLAAVLWVAVALCTGGAAGEEESLTYTIDEESDVDAFVGNVARDSELYSRFTQEEFQKLKYSISTQGSSFKIDENTSTIRTAQVLDREHACEFNKPPDPCELEFDVGVYTWEPNLYDLLMIVHVTVVLEDINDNAPLFPSSTVSLSVPESEPVGYMLLTSGAMDMDTGPNNSIQRYQLLPDKENFELQVMSSVDGLSTDLGLVLRKPLDREVQSVYYLQVIAYDGGYPQRSGSVNITIYVQDVNDNPPKFSQVLFNITADESARVGVPIVRLTATDPDAGQNGQVSFYFSSRTSPKILDQFSIDENTGAVILREALDFEKERRLQFVVEARDHGSPPQQSQAAVIINVADVNDNAPQIEITLPPGGASIPESLKVGSFIAHVSVSDADSGRNGELSCNVTNSHFRLEQFSGSLYIYKILLQRRLDYEVAHRHVVNVTCTDAGSPPKRNSTSFVIEVHDENDNAPVFTKPEYHISIRENNEPGRFIFQVVAMDPDSYENGNVTYSLLENPSSAFTIDPLTGVLRALKSFDREEKSGYHLVVQARDRGTPALSSTAVVHVDIDDQNDSPTHFAQPHFDFSVEERRPAGTVVDTLRVIDRDDMAVGQLQFSFLPESSPPPEFQIDVYTGTITTTRELDREGSENVYQFHVYVVDAENTLFNDSASVTVVVTDANDHAPVIAFPNKFNNTVRIPYNMPPGSIIARVEASDMDEGENGTLTFSVESSEAIDVFFMNGVSGELILTRRLEHNEAKTYRLMVTVQDSGYAIQMVSRTPLNVVVTLGNGSALSPHADKASHNIAIVVTLVCVTIALALAVLTTICIIRRIDRERKRHASAKAVEQNIYKQESLPPASVQEKTPDVENYENELEKLKRKIKRELSFVGDDEQDPMDSSFTNGTSASFSTFKNTTSGSAADHKNLSGPQASSSVLHNTLSPEGSAVGKRVHYADKLHEFSRLAMDPACRPRASSPPAQQPLATWTAQPSSRTVGSGLAVNTGEDAGSHTSGSTSDSGRGGSSEDDAHSPAGVCLATESVAEYVNSPRSYHSNQSLSTFRGPGGSDSMSTLPTGVSMSNSPCSSGNANYCNSTSSDYSNYPVTGMNSAVSAAGTPRSYLQAQNSSSYGRNISFSDDSITANTTVDCRKRPHQESQSPQPQHKSSLRTVGKPQSSPRPLQQQQQLLQQKVRHQSPSPGGQQQETTPTKRAQQSPPLRFPPDVSPLENRTGDDIYGVRGKVVNFSAVDSYQMTPRRAGTSPSSRLPGLSYRYHHQHHHHQQQQPHQSSALEDPTTGQSSPLGAKGQVSVNRTVQSSLGASYSLADVDDVLAETTAVPVDEEDRTTTTSGSYTINADDLCNEIEHLFFNDVVV